MGWRTVAQPLGYNPLRWDCEKQGCFNRLKRPKIEVFAECFPGRINFGDVDGVVEINGHFLYLEWKPAATSLSVGQRLLIERRTRDGVSTYLIIAGNAETMEVERYAVAWNGKIGEWKVATLDDVKERIKNWVAMARKEVTAYREWYTPLRGGK
jgi:hypothetical protein